MKLGNPEHWPLPTSKHRLVDWILVSDPGLERLRNAARTMLVVVATVLISYLTVGQKTPVAPLFGGIVGLLGSLAVNDPDPRQQKITTLLLIVPASLSITLGALLASFTWLSNAMLVVLIFFAFYLRRFGPRFTALGMMAFMPFFVTSIVPLGFVQLPWMVAASAIGVACVYLFRFVLLRDKPERILRWSMPAFHTQLGLTLGSMIEAIEGRRSVEKAEKKLRHNTERLYECAATAERQLSAPDFEGSEEHSDNLRFYLFDSEMSAHILSEIAKRLAAPEDTTPSGVRDALLHTLRELREPLSKGDSPAGYEAAWQALEKLERSREQSPDEGPGDWSFQVQRAEATIRQLLEGAGADREAPSTPEDEPEDPEEDSQTDKNVSGSGSLTERLQTTTLQGIQAALAVGLAIIAGHLLSPNRSYWVVIAAFIVFMRARSIGETLARGFNRTVGTFFGLIAGFAVATVISGDLYLEIILVFACAFMAFYLFPVSYALLTFWITIALAIGYGLLGWLSESLLTTRFVDTLVGAAIGVAVSALVFPVKTTEKVKDSTADFLETFKDYVRDRVDLLAGGAPTMHPVEEVRNLGGKLREVTQTAGTVKKQATVFGRSKAELDHLTTALMALDHYAGHLARPVQRENLLDGGSPQSDLLKEIGERIAANVDALRETLHDGQRHGIRDIGDLSERLVREIGGREPTDEEPAEDLLHVLHCLRRINRTIMDIATEFGAEAEQNATTRDDPPNVVDPPVDPGTRGEDESRASS